MLVPIFESGGVRERYAFEFPNDLWGGFSGSQLQDICRALGTALTKLEMSPVLLGSTSTGFVGESTAGSMQEPPTWSMLVETREPEPRNVDREEALGACWTSLNGREVVGKTFGHGVSSPGLVFHPLKSIIGSASAEGTPPVVLNLYVEDGRAVPVAAGNPPAMRHLPNSDR